jgi:hypothetical protein
MKARENIILTSEYGSFRRQAGMKWVGYQIASCDPVYAKWMEQHEGQSTFGPKWIQAHGDSTSNL